MTKAGVQRGRRFRIGTLRLGNRRDRWNALACACGGLVRASSFGAEVLWCELVRYFFGSMVIERVFVNQL